MSDVLQPANESPNEEPKRRPRVSRRAMAAAAAIGLCAAGAALGAGGTKLAQNWQPQQVMLLQPASIRDLRDDTTVAVKGEVKEIYGNKFIVQDASARALVDLGPRGEDRQIVTLGETVTVQGRFDRGAIRAQLVAHSDGRNDAFGPPGPKGPKEPPKGPKGLKERADRVPPPPPPPLDDDDAPPKPAR